MPPPAQPSTGNTSRAFCEAATRKWALVTVGIFFVLVAVGAAVPIVQESAALALPFLFVGLLAYWFCHVQLYRAVRDDIVMAPKENERFIRLLRWYGPAAAVELVMFIATSRNTPAQPS